MADIWIYFSNFKGVSKGFMTAGVLIILPDYVRRFKNDVTESSVRDYFQDREIKRVDIGFSNEDISFLEFLQELKLQEINNLKKGMKINK